ncbi:MAG: type I-E CRISPR-associated protein Cas6/Cse3/CasE [Rhodospirillales bacterium]|nr:type I-E CRISPR-associated protein Cas6/Cse3/CasE [Rhodospirillales bacterium]
MSLYLTRAELDRHAGAAALAPLLDPPAPGRAADAHHRLMWSLFPDRDAARDFLWRADGQGRFFVLSRRPPAQSSLFRPLATTPFEPVLARGDRLAFLLRANATRQRRLPTDAGRRPRRVDLVMDVLHGIPGQTQLDTGETSERPARRTDIARTEASNWFASQGKRHGFTAECVLVDDYSVRRIPRGRHRPITLGVLDLRGILIVNDITDFLSKLASGYGRGKAFGCGLMLIRRA